MDAGTVDAATDIEARLSTIDPDYDGYTIEVAEYDATLFVAEAIEVPGSRCYATGRQEAIDLVHLAVSEIRADRKEGDRL